MVSGEVDLTLGTQKCQVPFISKCPLPDTHMASLWCGPCSQVGRERPYVHSAWGGHPGRHSEHLGPSRAAAPASGWASPGFQGWACGPGPHPLCWLLFKWTPHQKAATEFLQTTSVAGPHPHRLPLPGTPQRVTNHPISLGFSPESPMSQETPSLGTPDRWSLQSPPAHRPQAPAGWWYARGWGGLDPHGPGSGGQMTPCRPLEAPALGGCTERAPLASAAVRPAETRGKTTYIPGQGLMVSLLPGTSSGASRPPTPTPKIMSFMLPEPSLPQLWGLSWES